MGAFVNGGDVGHGLLKICEDFSVGVKDQVLGSHHDAVGVWEVYGRWGWWREIGHVWWGVVLTGVCVCEGQEFFLFEAALGCYVQLHGFVTGDDWVGQ